jgi:hypothetical protein
VAGFVALGFVVSEKSGFDPAAKFGKAASSSF